MSINLKFHGTDTDTDTDTDFLADFRVLARKSACPAHAEVGAACTSGQSGCLGVRSRPTGVVRAARSARHEPDTHQRLVCGLLSDTRFSSRGSPLGMRACTRVRVLRHDKLSCTRLQNYTIGASLKSVSVSVSVSVP